MGLYLPNPTPRQGPIIPQPSEEIQHISSVQFCQVCQVEMWKLSNWVRLEMNLNPQRTMEWSLCWVFFCISLLSLTMIDEGKVEAVKALLFVCVCALLCRIM